jgi:archaetidylinositol phosphate synthase
MTTSDDARTSIVDVSAAAKVRPRREWVMLLVQPLATLGVRLLARTGVDPQTVVWSHTLAGIAAAALIAWAAPDGWPWAAGLLLLKTLLDNIDGGLARATNRVTEMGRYLDTVLDTIVNLALFMAVALTVNSTWALPAALGAYLLLMLLLSLDFNLERLYRTSHLASVGPAQVDPPGASAAMLALFRGFYERLLAPQDRWIEGLEQALFQWLTQVSYREAAPELRRRWSDLFSTAALVNLGLSTQLTLLAVLLLLGHPFAYIWAVYAMGLWTLLVYGVRVLRFRRRL